LRRLRKYIRENPHKLIQTNINREPDLDKRVILNLKLLGNFIIPDKIDTIYKILLYIDEDTGICKRNGCKKDKKNKNGSRWKLNPFCSRECADKDFSQKQRENNTSHRMTKETKNSMKEKLSFIVKNKIERGIFTPAVTNSWCHSRINVIINSKIIKVRSSWEAYFYIMNPGLCYENIRIKYYDSIKEKNRNYIVDFSDLKNSILYEIKPNIKIKDNKDKESAAIVWCKENGFEYIYITEEWMIENYDRKNLIYQPEEIRISQLIEKSINR